MTQKLSITRSRQSRKNTADCTDYADGPLDTGKPRKQMVSFAAHRVIRAIRG